MSCFLCGQESGENLEVCEENENEIPAVEIIEKYLPFLKGKLTEAAPDKICSKCWKCLTTFHKFFILIQGKFYSETCNQTNEEENSEGRKLRSKKLLDSNLETSKGKKSRIVKVVEDSLKLETKNEADQVPSETDEKDILKQSDDSRHQDDKESEKRVLEFCNLNCEKCSYKFKGFSDCKRHYRSEHGITGYLVCCKSKFDKKGRLFDHVNRHYFPDIFNCVECKKNFRDRYGLRLHMKTIHADVKDFECEICHKKFPKKFKLKSHMESHIPRSEMKFKCDLCDKLFPSKNRLDMHNKINHDPNRKLEICDICGKVLKSLYSLQLHRKEHLNPDSDSNRVHCPNCDHWLKNGASYRNHMRRHREEAVDCICKYCFKSFHNMDSMKSHIKYVHLDERKFQCPICEKAFKREWTLKEHMAGHTGSSIKLYECNFCDKTFNSSSNMHSHRKKMHPIEWQQQLMPKYLKPQ